MLQAQPENLDRSLLRVWKGRCAAAWDDPAGAMSSLRILYISGSIGLGHANRDLAIARELRNQNPSAEIMWLAGEPAEADGQTDTRNTDN